MMIEIQTYILQLPAGTELGKKYANVTKCVAELRADH